MAFSEIVFGLETDDVCGFTPDQRTAIELQLCVSLADIAEWKYWNFRLPRWRNFFGYAQIMSGEMVVRTVPIEHINQEILHWRDISFGINQTTGCYARGLATLIDKGNLIANTVKTRQRFTSVRFKFQTGVLANCSLRWETAEPKCDDVVAEPNEGQGNPPPPKNHQHKPEDRPESQGGDNDDPTVNDGMPYDNPDDRPPYAELLPEVGQWYEIYSAKNLGAGCTSYSGEYALPGATDQNITPILIQGAPGSCPGTFDGIIKYNGITVDEPQEYVSITFEFRAT